MQRGLDKGPSEGSSTLLPLHGNIHCLASRVAGSLTSPFAFESMDGEIALQFVREVCVFCEVCIFDQLLTTGSKERV